MGIAPAVRDDVRGSAAPAGPREGRRYTARIPPGSATSTEPHLLREERAMAERDIWSVDKIRSLFDLTGKVAIVTGGSGAFGHDAAKAMAAFGASVVVTSRRVENVESAAADIAGATGAKVLAVSCDVTDPESVEAMVQKTVDEFG